MSHNGQRIPGQYEAMQLLTQSIEQLAAGITSLGQVVNAQGLQLARLLGSVAALQAKITELHGMSPAEVDAFLQDIGRGAAEGERVAREQLRAVRQQPEPPRKQR